MTLFVEFLLLWSICRANFLEMEDWLPPLDLANLEGEGRDSFFEHFATTIWGLPRSEAVARVNALIRISKAGDVVRGTDGEPLVGTPGLEPPHQT